MSATSGAHHSRRQLLKAMGAAGSTGLLASLLPAGHVLGQDTVLPLNTPGLDHLDIIVPDVEASSRFYMALLKTRLHAQPFRGALRYFVLLGELNAKREVAYLAIGASNGRGSYIGHFCTSVFNWRRDSDAIWSAMSEEISAAGLGEFPGASRFGGIFADPDGIEIQFLPAPDTLVTVAEPSELVPPDSGLVTPLGLDKVVLTVSDLDKALDWYRILYGSESYREDSRARFTFPANGTHLILQESVYQYGSRPGISAFGIRTLPFADEKVATLLEEIGASNVNSDNGVVTFTDPDGIHVSLNPA